MKIKDHFWVAIRKVKDEDREFMDVGTFSESSEGAGRKSLETDKKIPWWASENPVIRIVKVECEEVSE